MKEGARPAGSRDRRAAGRRKGSLLALLGVAALPLAASPPPAPPPNIVLVLADDLGWGDLGFRGHPFVRTPNLDAMAEEAFVFGRFHAAAPVCSPTRASLLTGRHPVRTGATNYGRALRPTERTLAHILRDAGYRTAFFGKWHLGSGRADSPCSPGGAGFDTWLAGLNFFDRDPWLSRNGRVEAFRGQGTEIVTDEALAWLERNREGGRPIFLALWFPSPHDPHEEAPGGEVEDEPLYEGMAHAGYYREITLLDAQVGRLRRELRRLGLAERTLLWFLSDNGGLVEASSGGRGRKGSLYEGGLLVPSLLEWPGRGLRGRSDAPAVTSDVLPTVLALAGVEDRDPRPRDGVDLTPLLEGRPWRRPRGIGFWHGLEPGVPVWSDRILRARHEQQQAGGAGAADPAADCGAEPRTLPEGEPPGRAAWLAWPWKLHRSGPGRHELYDLAADPLESTDLAADPGHRAVLERLQRDLDAWMRSVLASFQAADGR